MEEMQKMDVAKYEYYDKSNRHLHDFYYSTVLLQKMITSWAAHLYWVRARYWVSHSLLRFCSITLIYSHSNDSLVCEIVWVSVCTKYVRPYTRKCMHTYKMRNMNSFQCSLLARHRSGFWFTFVIIARAKHLNFISHLSSLNIMCEY